jgi:hypothetical protein
MHTSSGVDNIDEYLETVTKQGEGYTYRYGPPVSLKSILKGNAHDVETTLER